MENSTATPNLPAIVIEETTSGIAKAMELVTIVEGFRVEDRESAEVAATQLSAIARFTKSHDALRLGHTRQLDQQKAAIKSEYDKALEKAGQAERTLRAELLRYQRKEERKAADARRAEEERLAAERKAAEAEAAKQQARAETLKTPEARERAEAKAAEANARIDELAVSSAPVAQPEKIAGFSVRKSWKPEVTDGTLATLVKAAAANPEFLRYLSLNQVVINQTVTAMKEHTNIPGVRAVQVDGTSVR